MKLIDAEILIKRLWEQHQGILNNAELYSNADEVAEEVCNLVSIVDDMPTAFDTEKVIHNLECEKTIWCGMKITTTEVMKIDDAIDIVKEGGVE